MPVPLDYNMTHCKINERSDVQRNMVTETVPDDTSEHKGLYGLPVNEVFDVYVFCLHIGAIHIAVIV